MFNTMTITKAAGALIGSLLALLLLAWAGSALFHVGPAEGAHGDEPVAQAYSIPVESSDGGEAEEEVQIDFAALMASADAAKGEKVFGKCKACHKVDGKNATGPHLDGVVGRPIGSIDGFAYSDAFKTHGDNWTLEHLDNYLTNPKEYIPGNKMSFAGLPKAEDRANVIAYLQSLSN